MELLPASPSFYSLDVNCLLNIFKRLDLDEFMNLAETCILFKAVVHRILERHCSINLRLSSAEKGEKYINRILNHIGPHVSWLEISGDNYTFSGLVEQIDKKNHKILRIRRLKGLVGSKYNFDNVEMLTLDFSDFPLEKCLLEKFKKLKHFNILNTNIDNENLSMVCRKNPGIESFVYRNTNMDSGECLDCKLFELMPKINTLAISISGKRNVTISNNISNLNSLLVLNQLTKLRLDCEMNLNDFLNNLALKGILEELELHDITFDNLTMSILNKFDKLQLLRIDSHTGKVLLESTALLLPPTLNHLYLCEFNFTHEAYLAMIQSLKFLQRLDIRIAFGEDSYFNQFFRDTLEVFKDNGGNHRLDVVFSSRNGISIEAGVLRTFQNERRYSNFLEIRILLPGLRRHALFCYCMDEEKCD